MAERRSVNHCIMGPIPQPVKNAIEVVCHIPLSLQLESEVHADGAHQVDIKAVLRALSQFEKRIGIGRGDRQDSGV